MEREVAENSGKKRSSSGISINEEGKNGLLRKLSKEFFYL
jgi:tRNA pseudouridine-54 N-methylase